MFAEKRFRVISVLTIALILLLPAGLAGQKKAKKKDKNEPLPEGTAVLWREPTDIASRDLFLGPGGEEMKPDLSKVTFIKEEHTGHSIKYRVQDGQGRVWVLKMSNEAQSETVASRLVWAAGYYTDVTYYVPEVNVEGKGGKLELTLPLSKGVRVEVVVLTEEDDFADLRQAATSTMDFWDNRSDDAAWNNL